LSYYALVCRCVDHSTTSTILEEILEKDALVDGPFPLDKYSTIIDFGPK